MDGGSEWSADAAVAEMTDAGAFGSGCAFVSYEPDERLAGSDQFATVVRFGTATVADGGGVRRRHRLVIKLKPPDPRLREFLNSDSQFHNEKLFYERAAPFLLDCAPPADGHRPPLCRYFYGRNECGALASRDMIVLENCCAPPRNYRMSDDRLDLDVDHVLTALRTLAKFHGLSYRAKHARPAEFHDLVAGFRDTHWRDGLWLGGIPVVDLLSPSVDELLRPERSDGDGTAAAAARRFRAEFLSDAYRAIRRTMEPVEPYAVLCHGDFNRNNLMFRYGGDGNPTVLDAMPFDMATVRYGSPALDLSFFLYLNTDRRLRDARWDAMLDEYCAALSAACSDVPCDAVPDRARLDSEMREHAFYGLAHVSFFSRFLMEQQNGEPTDAPRFTDGDVNGLEDVMRSLLSYGGHRAAERVTDVVRHFLRVRYGKSTPTTTT